MILMVKLQTALALGLFNLFGVFKYRIGVKTGLNPVQKLKAQMPSGQFFATDSDLCAVTAPSSITAFGYLNYPLNGEYPNWFFSALTQHSFQDINKPWYAIPDFDEKVGDIKGIWEASRFDWLLSFVLEAKAENHDQALTLLDGWLNDWCEKNPAYIGPNWKCGQEASIRVMHLITALIGLNALHKTHANVLDLIELHLQRIEPTINYAIAQDNNHGTSEATALFIGGELLHRIKPNKKYQMWAKLGRKWLENRANKLIMQDGGFSQYSVNYHRVMLDSYCLAEIIRQHLNLRKFSKKLYQQVAKATDWLYILTQENGDTPNLGANDGARLIPVSMTDYRDFRPTIQLASTLFHHHSYYQDFGSYDQSLDFFGIEKINRTNFNLPTKNKNFSQSGLIVAKHLDFFLAFKLPIFKFRPSQCDALHLDIWWNGENILRDGGTYSYNSTTNDLEYFAGVASHNTVQFDNHSQMPRLSRFLFGAWLKPIGLMYSPENFSCGYKDYWDAQHHRKIELSNKQIKVTDKVSSFKEQAILRWRLSPDDWHLNGNYLSNGKIAIEVSASGSISINLVEGEESRYYYQKTKLPVLEVRTSKPTTIFTVIQDLT